MDEAPPGTAVVVAGEEEIRILLRGLLRLHHFRVLGEASEEEEGLELVRTHAPGLLLVDSTLRGGSVDSLLATSRKVVPHLRTVIVAPPGTSAAAVDGVADAILQRPFRVRDFARAVGAVSEGPPPG